MSGGTVDDVFGRLMDEVYVPDDARSAMLAQLNSLKACYPNDTPAYLLYRARREGAAIPPSRCTHAVQRGECVACDARIGARYYFTASGGEVHTTPVCAVLAWRPKAAPSAGGNREPIAVDGVDGVVHGERTSCQQCVKRPARARSPRTPATATAPRPRTVGRTSAPAELSASTPPAVGDGIDWGGYSGVITDVGDRGVSLSADGVTHTAPWGDRATIRRQPPSRA
jgi:hypothetical protein